MSLKLYLIIITNAANINLTELPAKLDIKGQPGQTITLAEAQYRDSPSVGYYGDKIIIVSGEKVFDFYEKTSTAREKQLCALFPKSEIVVLALNSTVDLYGFSLIRNGQRVRVKSGNDEQQFINDGEPLIEEQQLVTNPPFSPEEMNTIAADHPDKNEREHYLDMEYSVKTVEILIGKYLGQETTGYQRLFNQIKVTTYGN